MSDRRSFNDRRFQDRRLFDRGFFVRKGFFDDGAFTGDHPTVSFEDVAGADESKEELKEVVEFLREPQKFIQLGARIPKGERI